MSNAITTSIETFKSEDGVSGTIEVTINGKTETLRCWNADLRAKGRAWTVTIYGIACKFQTGDKIWPAQITYWPEQNKFSALEPAGYTRVKGGRRSYQLIGFKSEFQDSNRRSQHNGGYRN